MDTPSNENAKVTSKPGGAHSPKPDKDKPKKSSDSKDGGPSSPSKGPARK